MNTRAMVYIGMGFECVAAVLGGFWLGDQADAYLGGTGLAGAAGSFLGLIGWIIHLLQVSKKLDAESEG